MRINTLTAFIVYFGLITNLTAQTFTWAGALLGSGTTQGYSVKTDASGNVFTTGIFNGTTDFDPGAGVSNLSPVSLYDVYITKFNSAGVFIWAKQVGGAGTDYSYELDIDASGNLYIVGKFDGTADFDPGAAVANLTSAGNSDAFVLKLDNNGNYIWARNMGGTVLDEGHSIKVDAGGNVLTTGMFAGTADFDPSAAVFNLTTGAAYDIFVSKLDASGNFVWAKQFAGTGSDLGYGITTDASNNVYSTGSFNGTVDFDPGAATYNLVAGGGGGVFISKLDASGNFIWAKAIIGGNPFASEIDLDASNNVFLLGHFYNTPDFDPGAATFTMTIPSLADDIFVEKLDVNGNFLWAKQMGGPGQDQNYDLDVDASGNAFSVGYFATGGPADFDPGPSTYTFTSFGSNDAFISKLDANGNFVSANQIGSTTADAAYGVYVDASGNIYCNGSFNGTVDFDPSAAVSNLVGTGDGFVFKWSTCAPAPSQPGTISGPSSLCIGAGGNYSVAIVAGASSYIWNFPSGWTGTSTTNIISATCGSSGTISVSASNGCASSPVRTLAVTINPLPTITVNSGSICAGSSFTLSPAGASTFTFSSGAIVTPSATSSYSVTGTSAAGCLSSNTAVSNVTVNPTPTISASSSTAQLCIGSSATLTASGGSTYTWNPGGAGTTIVISPTVNATYIVTGTGTNGCVNSNTITQTVINCGAAALSQISPVNSEIKIYPNPSNGIFYLLGNINETISIYNVLGEHIHTEVNPDSYRDATANCQLDLSQQPNGIYFIKVGTITKKIIKE
jgi:hypothetical protein